MGFVYLLHYAAPLSGLRNRHYLGYSPRDPKRRIAQHRKGSGKAVFTREAARQGIPFEVAGIWEDVDGKVERRLKNQKNAARYCAVCQPGRVHQVPPRLAPPRRPAQRRKQDGQQEEPQYPDDGAFDHYADDYAGDDWSEYADHRSDPRACA